jgi:hypothetical protein
MHSSLALLTNSFIEAFAGGSANRGCEQGTLRYIDKSNSYTDKSNNYIDKSNNYTGEATKNILGPKPGILLQMAEHFPHCSAGGRGVRPPTVNLRSEFSRRTKDVFLKTPPALLVARFFAPEKLNPPSYPGREPMVVGWERNSTEPRRMALSTEHQL